MRKDRRHLIRITVTGILFLLLLSGNALAAKKQILTASCPSVCAEKVTAYQGKNGMVLFLPGFWDLSRIVLEPEGTETLLIGRNATEINAGTETDLSGLAGTGQEPPLGELSRAVGIGEAGAALALEAIAPVHSLSEPLGGESGEEDFSLEQLLADEDPIERRLDQIALGEALAALPPLWRQIVMLRYYREYSQQATADALGLTQVKISREEKKIFARLRAELADGG